MLTATIAVLAVSAVHEEVHEWASEQQKIGGEFQTGAPDVQ